MRLIGLDFETANDLDTSICAIGLAELIDGVITASRYWLVKPPRGHGWFHERCMEVHGLTWEDVADAPEFPALAEELFALLEGGDLVVAHNASFDIRKLRATISHFGVDCPTFPYVCTLRASRRFWPDLPDHRLPTVAAHIGHVFEHHHALADAEASARIFDAIRLQTKSTSMQNLSVTPFLRIETFGPFLEHAESEPKEEQNPNMPLLDKL